MKRGNLEKLSLGLALLLLSVAGGCLPSQAEISSESTTSAAEVRAEVPYASAPIAPEDEVGDLLASQTELAEAPTKVISSEKPIPSNIRTTTALSEMIRLAQSGVEESVMLAFVTNSTSTFSLGAQEIIYLSDIGVPAAVVTAMLKHDHLIVESVSNAPAPPPAPEAAPLPQEQPLEGTAPADFGRYPAEAPTIEPTESEFYDTLAPYGTWVDVGGYG